jgi:MFS family permease
MASHINVASNRTLYFCAFVACLSGALFGYSVGFIGGILVLPSFLHHFHLDELPAEVLASATSATVSAWLVGALIGVPLGMPVCSRLGRRYCLWFCAVLYVLGAGLQLVGNIGVEVFDLGRLLNGLGVGVGTLVSPM